MSLVVTRITRASNCPSACSRQFLLKALPNTSANLHVVHKLRYLTLATFPSNLSFTAMETCESNFPRKYAIYLLLTRATTNYTGGSEHDPTSVSGNDANFRESSTRGCKLFNRSVCGRDVWVQSARVCVQRLAWLCRDSSLQFVRWSKATAGAREHYRR